ncbi:MULTISPECIES: AMP-binding protein [Bradyrhizobium]|jgi:acyl-CoA synthetase (AMP-forming)/AMP-acid ligase II|uniref:class I adenylate-forming enzyme family protein n=1 Tax=Bradyrhizobium TaxID=374 RepID=UPI0003F62524|nr:MULTISPECIES: AMP-binding protein [Bradyrhizobium]AUC96332.1 long-chain fatty acid--CoA ligase [Bradyrhizobium sp. SK17]KIU50551.1 long-chain fatty acid--CoA ligase [Bradyrhizobium elkanii]MBK5655043.1 AMP-binding protein [Rhizobium sp.]OCX27370.1 long-chain fatty acid--CoA ligase [Bradyrhizobium sp. UASWS1016]
MSGLRSPGQMLSVHARLRPDDVGIRDLDRSLTFRQWNARACRLANALLALGLNKGDRVAVLAYNCIEWGEIYAATAKSGLVAVPVNFRLVGREIRYIAEDAGIAALIVQHDLVELIDEIRDQLTLPRDRFILFGAATPRTGFRLYEALLAGASDDEPTENVAPGDPWTLMYTSGTTGNPKGVVRNHLGAAHLSLVTSVELGIRSNDTALLAMPMCHANSLYFFGAFTTCGAACTIYSRKAFDPENFLRALAGGGATFTSLVPTHYIMLLGLSAAVRASCDLTRVTRLMISSAPARPDTKRAVMEMFPNSGLFELYGATETGWVTMLHPDEQFSHLGSVGRECVGSAPIRILDEQGQEVPDGEAGELYSCTPYTFDGYWGLPEKTRAAFHGAYCTVGDMARRDEAGFIRLVDRKSNMIISGGENIYPSEVETLVGGHPMVKDVAVIGVPDEKWGERVHAVVVPHDGVPIDEATLQDWVRTRIAGYKCPKSYAFIAETEMPRNATGKVLHRELRARFGGQAGGKP